MFRKDDSVNATAFFLLTECSGNFFSGYWLLSLVQVLYCCFYFSFVRNIVQTQLPFYQIAKLIGDETMISLLRWLFYSMLTLFNAACTKKQKRGITPSEFSISVFAFSRQARSGFIEDQPKKTDGRRNDRRTKRIRPDRENNRFPDGDRLTAFARLFQLAVLRGKLGRIAWGFYSKNENGQT